VQITLTILRDVNMDCKNFQYAQHHYQLIKNALHIVKSNNVGKQAHAHKKRYPPATFGQATLAVQTSPHATTMPPETSVTNLGQCLMILHP
jgi:hypothetical protein